MVDKELVFKALDESLVVISTEVANSTALIPTMSLSSPESAGVLIGERRGIHIVLTDLSEPSQLDIRSRFMVDRISKHHQQAIDDAFKEK